MTSSVEECALRARSTHGVHHAIVEVNIVIGVVLREVLVARVVPFVVDAVICLTLGLIAHVVIVVFVAAIFEKKRKSLYGKNSLHFRLVQKLHQKETVHGIRNSISKFPQTGRQDFNFSTESTISTSLIHNRVSE